MCRAISFLSLLLVVTGFGTAAGDTLFLVNGDKITGTLQKLDEGAVVFDTAYAGTLRVQQAQVERIETDQAVNVLLKSGAELDGALEFRRGQTGVRTETGWQAAPMADLSAVRVQAPADGSAPAKPAADKRQWNGSVDAGMALRRGNTDTTDFNLSGTVSGRTERDTLTLRGSGAYGEAEDILNTRRYQGEGKWQVYPRERLYLYGLAGAEHDDGRKLDVRAQGGVGIGYDFIEAKNRKLSGDVGLTYTFERWNPYTPQERDTAKATRRREAWQELGSALGGAGGVQALLGIPTAVQGLAHPLAGAELRTEEFATARLSAQYEQTLFERSKISENLTVQPNLDQMGEYRLTSDLAFTTPISKELGLRVNLKSEYDSLAGERGVDGWDNSLLTGLHYEFGAPRKPAKGEPTPTPAK
jgi:putative salt-induced outer membrane protein YdiY